MENVVALLQAHGLTAAALGAMWFLLKYYIGRDIAETRAGITESRNLHSSLKQYVEDCEDDLGKKLLAYDKELAMLKQEHNHLATDIKTAITRIEDNLADHTKKEEIYQRDITQFMGYVYRYMGGPLQGPGAPNGFPSSSSGGNS